MQLGPRLITKWFVLSVPVLTKFYLSDVGWLLRVVSNVCWPPWPRFPVPAELWIVLVNWVSTPWLLVFAVCKMTLCASKSLFSPWKFCRCWFVIEMLLALGTKSWLWGLKLCELPDLELAGLALFELLSLLAPLPLKPSASVLGSLLPCWPLPRPRPQFEVSSEF